MRITLTIDDDVLELARAEAKSSGESVGGVISRLARRGHETELTPLPYPAGFRPFQARPGLPPATLELVNAIRDDTP